MRRLTGMFGVNGLIHRHAHGLTLKPPSMVRAKASPMKFIVDIVGDTEHTARSLISTSSCAAWTGCYARSNRTSAI
ncbi:MAG: hypothetical protein ACI8PT_001118 [Gammaproteobacteria bacterium]|jgi:hypothetical protein